MARQSNLLLAILASFAFLTSSIAQPDKKSEPAAKLFSDKGRHHHPIATSSPEAQKFFDQGMTLYYGFNHAEAIRSFRKAAELDPNAAMPHWGIGLALGPNYNRDIDPVSPQRNKEAFEEAQQALKLAESGDADEAAFAKALVRRYSIDPKADHIKFEIDYKNAMGEVVKAYPDDLDAATLYAEAIMNLRPWKLWDVKGNPAEGTEELVKVLESVLKRDPDHVGANHYYIHAMEASTHPERALLSAHKLLTAVPWCGHLVHMPGHIFIHTGDYELAVKSNVDGIAADEEHFKFNPEKAVYRLMYHNHNWHFVVFAHMMAGDFDQAKKAADKLSEMVEPEIEHMLPMQGFAQEPLKVLLRFHRYDEILKVPAPRPKYLVSRAFWHYARGMAFAAQGKREEAKKAVTALETTLEEIPRDFPFGTNPAHKVLDLAREVLAARLADDPKTAIKHWRKALEMEFDLSYGEPPDWYYPIRESLGAALLRDKQAAEAEAVFRDDLLRHRRNGRSLFGLMEALKAQGKMREAALVKIEFDKTWKKGEKLDIDKY